MRWLLALLLLVPGAAQAERIKDIGTFAGVRSNQLVGYGVVVGLAGTGDDNLAYSTAAVKGVAGRLGLQLPPGVQPGLKNAAAVIVTADLPPFAKPGQRIDITVSALGKAKSLRGGTLVLTPLTGADGEIYAMAQGSLVIGGLGVEGRDGSRVSVNVPSAGRIPNGATVERAVATGFTDGPALAFNLAEPDFATAQAVRDAVNGRFGAIASTQDAVTVAIQLPADADTRATMMAEIGALTVATGEAKARVIVNSRTGTVVINSAVRLAPAAIAHGTLTIRIDEAPRIVQPEGFSDGVTALEESSTITVRQEPARVALLAPGPRLQDIVDALNRLGVTPGDLVAILEALKQAGALKAELVVL